MGSFQSKTKKDIWMHEANGLYKYIGVYIDDLIIISKNLKGIIDVLWDWHNFKLMGTGPILFHLGCDCFRDDERVLCSAPWKYIKRMMDNYWRIFGKNPKPYSSPLTDRDHLELDDSPALKRVA